MGLPDAYRCGGSAGLATTWRTGFPFNPPEGDTRTARMLPAQGTESHGNLQDGARPDARIRCMRSASEHGRPRRAQEHRLERLSALTPLTLTPPSASAATRPPIDGRIRCAAIYIYVIEKQRIHKTGLNTHLTIAK